jgi:uncharacterized protein with HEPN domain
MNGTRDARLRLDDILNGSEHIAELVERGREACESDWVVHSALIHELTMIGEACAGLPVEVRDDHPEVPWRDIVAMRNGLIHRYFGLDFEETWVTATRDVPALSAQVRGIMAGLSSGE